MARLDALEDTLLVWTERTNLIAKSTVPRLWTRHISDSLQLLDLAPDARCWIDLGSGAGFPGLVIACALASVAGAHVHLVEANAKKAAFLREAVRVTGAPALVHAARIEKFVESFDGQVDIVTARALAPLKLLLDYSERLLGEGAVGLFPKGLHVEAELTEASKYWNTQATLVLSRTDPSGRIVVVNGCERRSQAAAKAKLRDR
ncbi:MAG: 16S rRNA (guanine(527)-N(7))-methyltransferase RsmG [Burkholderiales bacterium]